MTSVTKATKKVSGRDIPKRQARQAVVRNSNRSTHKKSEVEYMEVVAAWWNPNSTQFYGFHDIFTNVWPL